MLKSRKTSALRHTRLAIFATLLALFASSATAQAPQTPAQPPHIVVSGMGTATASPDTAEIEIGVVTQAKDAAEATRENAARLDAVLKAARSVLPKDSDIQTAQLSVRPNYQYPEGKAPLISDYTATNTVRIETRDLKGVGTLIDRSMEAGANNVQSLQFSVEDERGLRATALAEAVADAEAQAQAIAKALKLRVLRVLSVQADRGSPPIVYAERAMAMKSFDQQAPTPVEAGDIDLTANVTLTLEVGP